MPSIRLLDLIQDYKNAGEHGDDLCRSLLMRS